MSRNSLGFTLVELLVALMLAAMLLSAVIGVVGRIGRNTDRITADAPQLWKAVALQRIEQEMLNGQSFTLRDNSLTIRGYSDRSFPSQTATLRKNTIEYFVTKDGWLIRAERGISGERRNLVCDGMVGISVIAKDGREFIDRSGGFGENLTFRFSGEQSGFQVVHAR